MLMHSAPRPFVRDGWVFEPKLDGMRGLAIKTDAGVRLYSRNGVDFSWRYPALVQAINAIARKSMVLDGEIVAFDENGKPCFERLQERIIMSRERDIQIADKTNPVSYFVFDLLERDGVDFTARPLIERRDALIKTVYESDLIKHVQQFECDGISLFAAAAAMGLEGIVGKNLKSPYQPGIRSKNWIKVKHTITADVVIAGYRADVGFLVGRYDDLGNLVYCGSVIGGLRSTEYEYLDKVLEARQDCPFASNMRSSDTIWFEPRIVAEVKFMHWTSGGYLRMPSFTRLRMDLQASGVRCE